MPVGADRRQAERPDAIGLGLAGAATRFGYDGRTCLISESRVTEPNSVVVYDLTYTYDQLGNRKTKQDYMPAGRLTEYVYDTDPNVWADPNHFGLDPQYQTRNNRLLLYREYDPNAAGGSRLVRTVRYTYYVTGHVSNITIKDEDPSGGDPNNPNDPNNPYNWYYDLALYYSLNHALQHAVWDRWRLDPNTQTFVPDSGQLLWWRELQYDSPRELVRVQDYAPRPGGGWDPNTPPERRTDYLGGQPYRDYTTLVGWDDPNGAWTLETTEVKRYLGGFGTHAEQTVSDGETQFLHGDLIRSTMMTTDAAGSVGVPPVSYTAFGEPVWTDPNHVPHVGMAFPDLGSRYQYAGGWGYHTGLPTNEPNVVPPNDLLGLRGTNPNLPPITLLHIGARWYDPALGRFVQRDPIGLRGERNLYVYCGAEPLVSVDPSGLILPPGMGGEFAPPVHLPQPKGFILGGETKGPAHVGPALGGGVDIPLSPGDSPGLFLLGTVCVEVWDVVGFEYGGIVGKKGHNQPGVGPFIGGHLGPLWVLGGYEAGDGGFIAGGVSIGPFFGGAYW